MNKPRHPTLVLLFRETFEGDVGGSWITDGLATSGVFGMIRPLKADNAFSALAPGHRSVAEHVAHLLFSLKLFHRRILGETGPADWDGSFEVENKTPKGWKTLQNDLSAAYDDVVALLNERADVPMPQWPPEHIGGLASVIGHNAYHLGAIRQIILAVT